LFPTATLEILRRHYKIHAVIAVWDQTDGPRQWFPAS
jgi:hypothetical protein